MVNGPKQPALLLAPAERADLIVDFRNVPGGLDPDPLQRRAGAVPDGRSTATTTTPATRSTPPCQPRAYGPNTRTLLQIRVKPLVAPPTRRSPCRPTFTPTDPFLVAADAGRADARSRRACPVRHLTLNEDFDAYGRLIQFLGTDQRPYPGHPGAFRPGVLRRPDRGHPARARPRSGRSST